MADGIAPERARRDVRRGESATRLLRRLRREETTAMSRRIRVLACVFLPALASAGLCAAPPGITLHVARNGNDAWSGRLDAPNAAGSDGPFATPARARAEIRRLKAAGGLPGGGAVVEIRAGVYELAEPLDLGAGDSGTEASPIVYRARTGDEVRLAGGRVIRGFAPVTDAAVLDRLDDAAKGKVLQADLKALGIADFGEAKGGGIELFFGDKPMTLARWPNEGFVTIADVVVQDGHQIHGARGSKVGRFTYDGDRPARWLGEKDPWLHGYWFWDWSAERQKIESIDPAQRIIAVAPPYHGYGYRKGQWYYAFNMLCELDSPGEWYLDRQAGVLYFWPPEPTDKAPAVVSVLPSLLAVKNASHVTLRGFILEAVRGTAVTISACTRVEVAGCTIRNAGGSAVSIDGGSECAVIGCDIHDTGRGGISLSGGDRTALAPARHRAENNNIHDYGRWERMYQAGVHLAGVGNIVRRNLIHNAPHMAIMFGGNDHVIELNEIHSVCYESNDAGAMYAGRNWTMRGHVIRHNYLHHISGFRGRGCVGVYLDDMFASAAIRGNIFFKVTAAAFIGGGRDNRVENNIFVDCNPALHIDARALGWAHYHADEWIQEGREKGTISGIAYDKPPYRDRYPELAGILDDDPKAPKGNVIARNICAGGRWDDIEGQARPLLKLEDNLVGADPLFVDAANLDFRLRDDSPAWKLGFERIPVESIGLYEDERRASWPVAHDVRE